jgi:hypothetical protein
VVGAALVDDSGASRGDRFLDSPRGAAYSGEILDEFGISESTLRRRRSELRALGIEFAENGRGSLYFTAELARQLPTTSQPQRRFYSDGARA